MRTPESEPDRQWLRAADYLCTARPRSSHDRADVLDGRDSQEAFERAVERELIGDEC